MEKIRISASLNKSFSIGMLYHTHSEVTIPENGGKDILILSSLATMQLVQVQYDTPGLFSISDYLNEDSKDCDDYEDDSV